YFDYSHNLLLDIALEQGILGLLAFGFIYLSAVLMGIRSLRNTSNFPLVLASLAGIAVIFVHGLVDNIIYYQWGSLLVFIIPGFMLSTAKIEVDLNNNEARLPAERTSSQASRFGWRTLGVGGTVGVVVVLVILGFSYRQGIMSAWYANLGAVEMARIELDDFPSGQWDDGGRAVLLEPAQGYFLRALDYDPDNRTANHRLGLIAMQQRDFSTATSYLVSAHQLDSDHRGISKNLGYAYAWSGEFDQAAYLLAHIPEARQELSTYTWWWGTQGREDLAENANRMLVILDSQSY
ncbi:MAG: tetratricopeptide repeat protein, partial [Anaerolineales bacterium]|nr:tetratricopeptide repeat protein [Anaerolineales bacterium]